MSDLRECPFCGGEVFAETIPAHEHVFADFMPDYPGSTTIECYKCSAAMIAETMEGVSAQWNTRASDATIAAILEECEKSGWERYTGYDLGKRIKQIIEASK